MVRIFGIDFGTTNSLVSLISGGDVRSLVNANTDSPHPSIVIARGDQLIVGQDAKSQADEDEGSSDDIIQSPKAFLGLDDNQHPVKGREDLHRVEIASAVLQHLADDARNSEGEAFDVARAVFTVPVSFDGRARNELRQAATKAGIQVSYFVHEPLAALYGYFKEIRETGTTLHDFEGRYVLVFDWGGGTLDLTLCQIRGGVLHQIKNAGDPDIGGDRFDANILSRVEKIHAAKHGITFLRPLRNANVSAKARLRCEGAKKELSTFEQTRIFIRNYLDASDGSANLVVDLTRQEIEDACKEFISSGLDLIQTVLDEAQLRPEDVALCLPTGGMVHMPAIRTRLEQIFPSRVVLPEYGDRIISQGAAWIAHDGALPVLSKPIEMEDASGVPHVIAHANEALPTDGEVKDTLLSQFYCTDPREGTVAFSFQRPISVGRYSTYTKRLNYGKLYLKVDPHAAPLMERLELKVTIDQDYVVKIKAKSTMREDEASMEISNLEFSLRPSIDMNQVPEEDEYDESMSTHGALQEGSSTNHPVVRTIVSSENGAVGKKLIPGDIIDDYWGAAAIAAPQTTKRQDDEKMYYQPCMQSGCGKSAYEMFQFGCVQCGITANPL